MAVVDDPTAKRPALPSAGRGVNVSRPHKPLLDEMGIAVYHEVKPARPSPRSTTGKPGMRGGWKPRGR
jgi:excinuclease ABC subunit B